MRRTRESPALPEASGFSTVDAAFGPWRTFHFLNLIGDWLRRPTPSPSGIRKRQQFVPQIAPVSKLGVEYDETQAPGVPAGKLSSDHPEQNFGGIQRQSGKAADQ